VIERADLSSTGGHTWPAAHKMLKFLEAGAGLVADGDFDSYCTFAKSRCRTAGCSKPSHCLNVLELGSGCGWLAFSVAWNWLSTSSDSENQTRRAIPQNPPAFHICATEQVEYDAFQWLQHNLNTVIDHHRILDGFVCAKEFSWGNIEHQKKIAEKHWHFIIASDVVYEELGAKELAVALSLLVTSCTVGIYAHTKHRYDHLDLAFFENMNANGLDVVEITMPGESPTPPSPPPMTEIFPEKRIAFYKITKHMQELSP